MTFLSSPSASPAPPIAQHELLVFLLQVALLLGAAVCLGRLARRLGMPTVVGELLTGVLLGPTVLGRVVPQLAGWMLPPQPEQAHLLDALSQLGALLLVGVTGIQLDVQMMRRRRTVVAGVSIASLVLPLALGVAAGFLLPAGLAGHGATRTTFALFIGVAMGISAIPVIAKTLTDMNLLHRNVGQLILAAGVIADSAGWLLLSAVTVLAAGQAGGRMVVPAVGFPSFVLAAVLLGRRLVRAALRVTGGPRAGTGAAAGATAAIIVMGAACTQALGLEGVLGAFVAGVLVGTSGQATDAQLAALRAVVLGVLAPIFLASAGLRMDLAKLADPRVLAAAAVLIVVAVAGKFAGAYLGARLCGLGRWEGCALGAGLNARGVVEIVVATVGLRLGVLGPAMYTIIVLVAVVTSLMAPPLLRFAMTRVEHSAQERLRHADLAAWPLPRDTGAG